MAEMLIQSESLTAIADEIRVLSGTEDAMSLDAMENHVEEANTNIATEADLIAQIAGALEGKAGSGASVQTCTIKFDSKYNDVLNAQPAVLTRYVDGAYTTKIMYGWGTEALKDVTVTDVVCGSAIVLANMSNLHNYTFVETTSFGSGKNIFSGGVKLVKIDSSLKYVVFMAPTEPGATGIIGLTVA